MAENNDSISPQGTVDDVLDGRLGDPVFGGFNLSIYQALIAAGKSKLEIAAFLTHLYESTYTIYGNKNTPLRVINTLKEFLHKSEYTDEELFLFFTFLIQLLIKLDELKIQEGLDKDPQVEVCRKLIEIEVGQLSNSVPEDKKVRSVPTTDQAIYFIFYLFHHHGIGMNKDEQAAIIAFLQGKSLESTRQRFSTIFTDKKKNKKTVDKDYGVIIEMFRLMNASEIIEFISRERNVNP